MLFWAALSLTLALASALVGFGGVAPAVAEFGRVLAVIFLLLFVAALALHGHEERHRPF